MAWRGFTLIFLATLLLGGSIALVFGRLPAAARCRPSAVPDTFLSECASLGDYEHAAFAFGLEPEATAALKASQVVVLGNSRAQFAFSTRAAQDWFASRGIRAYDLGFGSGEAAPFALAVLRRSGARPRLAIVNADPFFSDHRSAPARRIETEPARAWVGGLRTKVALEVRAAVCARLPVPAFCRGRHDAVFRVRGDGAWSWRDSFFPRERATAIDEVPGEALALPEGTAERARAFLSALGLRPACVVLTAVPNSKVGADRAATALARAIGAHPLLPRVAGLRTLDGSHLDAASAERWSAAFFEELQPVLRECV